jgi:sensor histidine kinase YesM
MQTELSRLEGMALRLQMNPHFIFNALDSISNFIFSNKQEEAIHYLSSFAKLIRNTLESAHEHQITLRTEVDILKSYLELESMRNGRRLKYKINCDDELMEDYAIPPLIIQPYVENAVKHGLKPRKGKGNVSVDFFEDSDILKVIIVDDGIGRVASEELKKKQMGMLKKKSMSMGITQQRLELLKQAWNDKVSVEIMDLHSNDGVASGTRVEVRLPLIEAEWSD